MQKLVNTIISLYNYEIKITNSIFKNLYFNKYVHTYLFNTLLEKIK